MSDPAPVRDPVRGSDSNVPGAERHSHETSEPVQAPRRRATRFEQAILLGAGAWVIGLLFLRWPAPLYDQINSNSNIDAAFFVLAGQLVRDGGVPYLTFWDHKPPLIYLIDALALTVSGGAIWGVWLATLAATLTALGVGYLAMRRMAGPAAAVIGTTWFAFSLGIVLPFNLTEGFVLPVQAAAMLVLARWSATRGPVWTHAVAAGALAGLAFLLRPNLIGAPAAVALTMGFILLASRRPAELTRLMLGFAGGAALVIAPVLLWLGSAGALAPFWDQVFHYNIIYSAASWRSRIRAAFDGITLVALYGTLLLPIAGWLVAAYRLRSDRRAGILSPPFLFAVLWLPVELALAALPGRMYAHYFAPLLLPLAYLSALFASEAFAAISANTRPSPLAARLPGIGLITVVVCMTIAIVPIGRTFFDVRDSGLRADRADQVALTARYVRAHSPPNTPLFVWGHASDVYLLADREPASRFVYSLPLLTPGYADSVLVRAFLGELRQNAPPLIVDATPNASGGENLAPSLGDWNPTWRYPESGVAWWTMTPALRGVYDYIRANYATSDTVGPQRWVVYRRAAGPDQRQ